MMDSISFFMILVISDPQYRLNATGYRATKYPDDLIIGDKKKFRIYFIYKVMWGTI